MTELQALQARRVRQLKLMEPLAIVDMVVGSKAFDFRLRDCLEEGRIQILKSHPGEKDGEGGVS